MSNSKVIVANIGGEQMVCVDYGDGAGLTVCKLKDAPSQQNTIDELSKRMLMIRETADFYAKCGDDKATVRYGLRKVISDIDELLGNVDLLESKND